MTAPIFIVGNGRSGTTLLRLMLCAHPRIYITHEASFYLCESLYPRSASRRDFLEYYFQSGWFRWLRLDPRRVLEGLPNPLTRDNVRDAFANVMREKAADYGRARFGDKTPAHSGRVKRILKDFPGARIIHIMRDPRSAAMSLTRMPWASRSLFCNAALYDLQWRAVRKWRHHLLQIRLEDLLADPRRVMGRVLEYVGEPWDEAVLDHPRHIPDHHDMPPFPWTQDATAARRDSGASWTTLSAAEIRMVEHVNRRAMRDAGYDRAVLLREPVRFAGTRTVLRDLPESVRFLFVLWRIRRWLRDPKNFSNWTADSLWGQLNPDAWRRYPDLDRMTTPPPLPPHR